MIISRKNLEYSKREKEADLAVAQKSRVKLVMVAPTEDPAETKSIIGMIRVLHLAATTKTRRRRDTTETSDKW